MLKEININPFTRKTKKGYKPVRGYKRKIDKKNRKPPLRRVALGAAITLGVGGSSYLLLRGRYRAGIKDSARWVKENISKQKATNLSDAEKLRPNINYTVGGLWYNDATRNGTQLANFIEKRIKGKTVPISTHNFNKLAREAPAPTIQNFPRIVYDLKITGFKNAFIKGHNPTARELATQVMANQKTYPDKIHILYGHSSGGTITNEAMLIMKEAGADMSKLKQVTYGANNYGVLDSAENSLHIVDRNDWQAAKFRFPGVTFIGKPNKIKEGKSLGEKFIEDHSASHYATSKESVDKVKNFLDLPAPISPIKTPVTKKVVGLGDKKDPSSLVNKVVDDALTKLTNNIEKERARLSKLQATYDKTVSNTKIPENVRTKAISTAKANLEGAKSTLKTLEEKLAKLSK